ncbi:MAG: glycosyltransferase [Candidatus Micrarchaeota archaeon]
MRGSCWNGLPAPLRHAAKGVRYLGYEALFSARKALGAAHIDPPPIGKDKPERIRRVLLCLNRHEYGNPAWGDSYEYLNWWPAIGEITSAEFFDFGEIREKQGSAAMHEQLRKKADSGEYDLLLFSLMADDFDRALIRRISETSPAFTLNWFSDDQWRFASFSGRWAGAFNFCSTTCKSAQAQYQALGYPNATHTQWGVYAPRFARTTPFGSGVPVAFVGQRYGGRGGMVDDLRRAGVDVQAFGSGWPGGRISHAQMADLFANAKITLCPAESSILFAPAQMKSRFFEVAACGGFQLAGEADELPDYFVPGKEIETYANPGELIAKIRRYLEDEDARRSIAAAGRRRALRDHTYQKRFEAIFHAVEETAAASKRA